MRERPDCAWDSLIRGTSAQSPIKLGKESAKIGFAILNGDDYEKTTYLDVFFIDASNVDMYGVDGWQYQGEQWI